MKVQVNRQLLKLFAVLLVLAAVLAAVFAVLRRWEAGDRVQTPPSQEPDRPLTYYDGAWYAPKEELETVLVMGLDKREQGGDPNQYTNDQQADFLMLLVIDREHKSYSALHLNRDTMTEIPIIGVTGELAGTITGQLALAHTYGSGGADSCRNTVEAVSKFLYGTEIDHYVSLTMDAVAVLNDLAGGVTVEVMDDFTAVDPTLVKGTNVTLMGQQALTYIRARGGLEDSSNLRRMERQRQYLTALREQVEKRRQEQPDFDAKAILSIADYLVSDYTANQMAELNTRLEGYTFREVLDVPGEAVHGTEFMEFYADETTLMETVMGLFYEKQDS